MLDVISQYRRFLNAEWRQPAEIQLPPQVVAWLNYPDSLTQKMQQYCRELRVQRIDEGWQAGGYGDPSVKNGAEQTAWVREVLIFCDRQPWIFAQTILPKETIEQVAKTVLTLGDQPIGLWLFPQQPKRLNLEWRFDPELQCYARRSTLLLKGYPLEIRELFLSQFPFEALPIKA